MNSASTDHYNDPFPKAMRTLLYEQDEQKKRKVTQESLAKALNVQRQAVGQWCNGESKPSIENLIKIADFFGVSLDWLLGRRPGEKKMLPSAKEDLGLPDQVISWLENLRDLPNSTRRDLTYRLLGSELFQGTFLFDLDRLIAARKADQIFREVKSKYDSISLVAESEPSLFAEQTGLIPLVKAEDMHDLPVNEQLNLIAGIRDRIDAAFLTAITDTANSPDMDPALRNALLAECQLYKGSRYGIAELDSFLHSSTGSDRPLVSFSRMSLNESLTRIIKYLSPTTEEQPK